MSVKKYMGILCLLTSVILVGCTNAMGENMETGNTVQEDIRTEKLSGIVFSLVSSAENSSLDYEEQYSYIEDIGDGRGYTGGIIGFTSGTGDMLEVVEKYVEKKPENNELAAYIPALEKVNGSSSLEGLGEAYTDAWSRAAENPEMREAQDELLDEMYLTPAVTYAEQDGLGALGQYIYYDALVVHGPGEDTSPDCFQGIRKEALSHAASPAQGGEQDTYLTAFLDARAIIMKQEEAHSDLSRLDAQRKFMKEGKDQLQLPLDWTMYGEHFELNEP
ncbi:MAG: chitosanase [Lachnospiraceae bacterium]|nr:chitosanase [Lachnospiraceae bacterium]